MSSKLYMTRGDTMKVNNRIREVRTEKGWTQEQLSEETGVSRQSINSIERGKYIPSLPLALKFARVFECSTDSLFQLKDQEEAI